MGEMRCLCSHLCHEYGSDGLCKSCNCKMCCCPDCEGERYVSNKMPRASHQRVRELTDNDAIKAAESPGKPVVLLIYNSGGVQSWNYLTEFHAAATELSPGVICFKVDCLENPRVLPVFGLAGTPSTLVFRKGNEVGKRLHGAHPRERVIHHVRKAIRVRA